MTIRQSRDLYRILVASAKEKILEWRPERKNEGERTRNAGRWGATTHFIFLKLTSTIVFANGGILFCLFVVVVVCSVCS